ncbi:murein biosynthesis integral membrane protein MurJ [Virgibacillus sp. JSM 102003]|uniref:murein biosynthesis integral membrane protein MurJ n=1 Tax=Virgibacillus sp. JSM 102003 TaxID=1562108 RepID=UPI0035BFB866
MKEVFNLKSKLGLASILFLFATIILKMSGLVRDMVIAYYFGDSYIADAYLAAFIIPNMIILFLTTGMKNALVPSYIQNLEENRGSEHLGQVFNGTVLISIILSIAGTLLARFYIPILYPEFNPHAKEIAIWVSVILFSSIIFVGMNAVLEAFFDSVNKFSLSMVSQIIVVVSTILGAVLFADEFGAYSLAGGYLIGTVISLFFKLVLVIPKKVMKVRKNFDWLEIKKFSIIFVPVGLTVAVGQINLTVDNIFASYFEEGVVTYINYAKNLVHFPQAIFGVTIGTIIFPIISKAHAKNDNDLFKKGVEKGLVMMFLIVLPSIMGLMLLMPNIVEMLYQRGAFGSAATMSTSEVAYFYFGSVLFFSLHNIVNKGFYTLKKGHLIMLTGIFAIILNIILNYVFTLWIGYKGIPLASSVMALFYVGTCFLIFIKLVGGINLKFVGTEFLKVTIATLLMSAVVLWSKQLFGVMGNTVLIIIIVVIGCVTYFVIAVLLRIKALTVLLNRFSPKKFKKNSH